MNIAEAQRKIKELQEERAEIYSKELARIDTDLGKLKQFIHDNCQHHYDFLLIDVEHQEDEYGKWMESWTTYEITCSICGRSKQVNKAKMDKSGLQFSAIVGHTDEDLVKLGVI
jgi:hypothetical protein